MAIATSRPGTDPVPGEEPATKQRIPLERRRVYAHRQDMRYAAVEIVATFDDGHEERFIIRRASSTRKLRLLEGKPGFRSASIVRRLSLDDWKDHCLGRTGVPLARLPRTTGPLASRGTDEPAATAPAVRGWELIIRQDGKARTIRVAASSEDSAMSLVMAIPGVDAATVLRPLSPSKFRDAAK